MSVVMKKAVEVFASMKLLVTVIAFSILAIPMSAFAYTYDELLPDFISTFTELKVGGGTYLYNYHKNPANAVSGNNFPTTWQTLSAGQDLRLKILLPPGVDFAGVSVEAPAMVANFGVCDGVPATCDAPRSSPPMLLQSGSAVLTAPKIVTLVVSAKGAAFTFSTLTITWHVEDIAAYEAWRKQRSWAAGTGDCDGLANAYCNSTATPTPTTTFSLTPSSQNVLVGGAVSLSAQNGSISSCVSNNPTVVPNPVAATGGASASSSVAANAASGTQVTITCTSTATPSTTATATVTVTAPTFGLTPSTQQVVPGANYTLTAQNGAIKACSSENSSIIPDPQPAVGGATAAGSVAATAAVGSQAKITCLSTTGGSASASITVSSAATQTLSLSGLGLTKLNSTSAEFSATVGSAGTGYWVAFPYAATAPATPSVTQIKAGQDASGVAATLKGSDSLVANTPKVFALSGLTAGTSYQVFFYAEDASGAKTAVTSLSFVTNTPAVTAASIVPTVGGTNALPVLSVAINPASNATGTKAYYVAALIPASVMPPNGALFFLTKSGWTPWTSGAFRAYDGAVAPSIGILDGTIPAAGLVGTDVYAGYGVSEDYVIKKIYTVVK